MSQGKVFFKDALAGLIEKRADGTFSFRYQDQAPAVSLTLPTAQAEHVSEDLHPFFDGLIPEGWLLNLAQKNWKLPSNDRMGLLLSACQDCIGAAHVLAGDERKTRSGPALKFPPRSRTPFAAAQCLACLRPLGGEENYHARCARRLFGTAAAPTLDFSLEDLETLALTQLNQRLTLTGVQQKLSLAPLTGAGPNRLTVMGHDGRFILKPASTDYPDMPVVEHLCMKIAGQMGLITAECGLVPLRDGALAYITKRFDREGTTKIQMEDFCQLSGKTTAKKYQGSAEALGKVIDQYSDQPMDDKLTLFQLLLFSFWTGNADMHLKNFSLWRDPRGQRIRMSPAYDLLSTRLLISAKDDPEEMALPINGKKHKLKWSDFLALAEAYKLPLKSVTHFRERLLDGFIEALELVDQSFLSERQKDEFLDLLRERSERLEN